MFCVTIPQMLAHACELALEKIPHDQPISKRTKMV